MTIYQIPFPYLQNNSERIALVEGEKKHTYREVNNRINQFATGLLRNKTDLQEERIAFFMPASLDYVTTMHGVWRAGGIAVPLNVASAVSELDHYLTCANVTRMVAGDEYQDSLRELCASLNIDLVSVQDVIGNRPFPFIQFNTHADFVSVLKLGVEIQVQEVSFNHLKRKPELVVKASHFTNQHRTIAGNGTEDKALNVAPTLLLINGTILWPAPLLPSFFDLVICKRVKAAVQIL